MKNNIQKLEELFKNISHLSPEQVEDVVHQFVKVFEQLVTQMQTGSEKDKEEAFAQAESLRNTLEAQAEKILEQSGFSYKEIQEYASNKENFSEEEWKSMQAAKKELEEYQNHLTEQGVVDNPTPKKATRKLKKSAWIPS